MNCAICETHCCGRSSLKPPLLFAHEVDLFVGVTHYDNKFLRVNRNEKGLCVFFSEDTHKCLIYEKRPIECQLYPYILRYKNKQLILELHDECPQKEDAVKPEIPEIVKSISSWWWEMWEKLSD